MDEVKKNSNVNLLIIIIFIVIITIFLIIFYIKKNSNNIESFKYLNKNNNPQETLIEKIKKINKTQENNNVELNKIDKTFFEEIQQAKILNEVKDNVEKIQMNLKEYKENDINYIKTKIDYILKQLEGDKPEVNESEVNKPEVNEPEVNELEVNEVEKVNPLEESKKMENDISKYLKEDFDENKSDLEIKEYSII